MSVTSTRELGMNERLSKAISRLMNLTPDGDRSRISVPILYPSGSSAAIEVMFNNGKCFVSDLALGQMEAEMHGADSFYDGSARKAAERFGVRYDGISIFAMWASIDNIEGAIASVANASVAAAVAAIHKAVEEKEKRKNTELFERVSKLFGRDAVSKEEDLIGRDAVWEAHNVVSLPTGKKVVFEFISENQNSIASKYMMFSDLSREPDRYSLTGVVNSIERIGKKGAMLADVSEVIQFSANDLVFLKRAA